MNCINWQIYDPMIRAGVRIAEIADKAGCTTKAVYDRQYRLGLKKIRKSGNGMFINKRFNYWKWLRGEIERLGVEKVKLRYGG